MSVKIRLARSGAKKHPFYRIIVADSRQPRDGRYLEKIGFYDPMRSKNNPDRTKINIQRLQYWLGIGAQPTDRILKIMTALNLMSQLDLCKQSKQRLLKRIKSQQSIIEKQIIQ